jgi:hypothetical protein
LPVCSVALGQIPAMLCTYEDICVSTHPTSFDVDGLCAWSYRSPKLLLKPSKNIGPKVAPLVWCCVE